jgi:hypothetical protein
VTGAKCTDLTSAAASSAVGKPTKVSLSSNNLSLGEGTTICNLAIAGETYAVGLVVIDSSVAAAGFASNHKLFPNVKDLTGIGDKAFTTGEGVEALSGNVDIKVTGPADEVIGDNNYTVPIAIAKAMVAALK